MTHEAVGAVVVVVRRVGRHGDDRRKAIEKLLLKDFPQLSPIDLMGVLRATELYATCNETLFRELEDGL